MTMIYGTMVIQVLPYFVIDDREKFHTYPHYAYTY